MAKEQTIEVVIPLNVIFEDKNCIFRNMNIIKRLKEKGVPAIAFTVLEGVEYGTLSVFKRGDDMVYRWVGSKPEPVKSVDPLNDDDEEL